MLDEWIARRPRSNRDTRKLYAACKPTPAEKDHNGRHIYHVAVEHGNTELLRLLLAEPDGVTNLKEALDYYELNALATAAINDKLRVVKLLYPLLGGEQKFKFPHKPSVKLTIIGLAARSGARAVYEWLLGEEGERNLDLGSKVVATCRWDDGATQSIPKVPATACCSYGRNALELAASNPRASKALVLNLVIKNGFELCPQGTCPSNIARLVLRSGKARTLTALIKEMGYRPACVDPECEDCVCDETLWLILTRRKLWSNATKRNLFTQLISTGVKISSTDTVRLLAHPVLGDKLCELRPRNVEKVEDVVKRMIDCCASPRIIVHVLTNLAVDPNIRIKRGPWRGAPPLFYALRKGTWEVFTTLLRHPSVNVTIPNTNGVYIWDLLPIEDFADMEATMTMLDRAPSIKPKDHPVSLLMARGHCSAIQTLLDNGYAPNEVDIEALVTMMAFNQPSPSIEQRVEVMLKLIGMALSPHPETFRIHAATSMMVQTNLAGYTASGNDYLKAIMAAAPTKVLEVLLTMSHVLGPMQFMAALQPANLVAFFRRGIIVPKCGCSIHDGKPPIIPPEAKKLKNAVVAAVHKGWAPTRHFLFSDDFRGRVVQICLVEHRLTRTYPRRLAALPTEMWWHILSFL